MTRPPVALTIAGSDPSGGAGIQADLKTFSALGAYGMSVITALTAQNTQGVTGIHVVPVDFVARQLDALLVDVRIDAVKVGMVANAGIAGLLADYLSPGGGLADRYTVLDPVTVATSGDQLLDDGAVDAVRALLPLVDVVTPNLPEAALLTGLPATASVEGMRALARGLREMGTRRALVKGGHLAADQDAIDLWLDDDGERLVSAPRVATVHTHGTGCTLSSALTALRPQRQDWATCVADAKFWLTEALQYGDQLHIGSGHGPVHHFYAFAPIWRVR